MAQNKVKPITLVSINANSLTTDYQPFNSAGLDGSCFYIRIVNASSVGVGISYDGINDHEVVLANKELQLYFQGNAQPTSWATLLPKGQVLYINGTSGSGTVYLTGYYVTP